MKRAGGKLREIVEGVLGKGSGAEFCVTGSGLAGVPVARINEIPKFIIEHHKLEAERTRKVTYLRRGI